MIYLYECPECEETYEKEAEEREEIYCAICAGDVGRDVRMRVISIRPSDEEKSS
jgi:hypothetical protein